MLYSSYEYSHLRDMYTLLWGLNDSPDLITVGLEIYEFSPPLPRILFLLKK